MVAIQTRSGGSRWRVRSDVLEKMLAHAGRRAAVSPGRRHLRGVQRARSGQTRRSGCTRRTPRRSSGRWRDPGRRARARVRSWCASTARASRFRLRSARRCTTWAARSGTTRGRCAMARRAAKSWRRWKPGSRHDSGSRSSRVASWCRMGLSPSCATVGSPRPTVMLDGKTYEIMRHADGPSPHAVASPSSRTPRHG